MAPNVGRGCFLCGSKDHDDCELDLDELTIIGEKIGLSGDALRAWLDEEKAKEREARREEAEREARARETELALAREVAALEERNHQLRIRLLEAQNAARARASVRVESVSFMDPGTWISDELKEAERSFLSVRQNTSQSGIDFGASGRQDTVNRGTVVLLGSSTKGTILSCPDNGGERRDENPQRVNVHSSSWLPPVAVTCSAAMGDCPKPKSEITFSDSLLVQRYATSNDVNIVEGSTSHFHQDPGSAALPRIVTGCNFPVAGLVSDASGKSKQDGDSTPVRSNGIPVAENLTGGRA
ncbi:hypothetical protein HPB50_013916 [Hyalomma asiaticum]|uniref:Uncharacterized protein n=1 Tax=Hyalomma asiaticum TaxID=266040 RepID=A0ACB7S9L5_HYAAI|nr:hypothetical protein HPB50_013916 [Hyalomma asiaticum]